ncbi:hypothetical protein BKA69DRAFT_1082254 [Paraphysoderma sedebokerense]|nr:hypothetical protein BKA69DRAFT_1082254 [Paraphysoderma sedebokerense]
MKSSNMDHAFHASRTDEQALHVEFGCRQNASLVCIWTASKRIRVYQLSNTGLLQTYSVGSALDSLNFQPAFGINELGDSIFFAHPNAYLDQFVLQKFNSSYNNTLSSVLPVSFSFPYNNSNYDLAISTSNHINLAVTSNSTSTGLGQTEIILAEYNSNLTLQSRFVITTVKQDNATRIFAKGKDIILIGTTDGDFTNPWSTTNPREWFIIYYAYINIDILTSKGPGRAFENEIVQINFSFLPGGLYSIPNVTFHGIPCSNVQWNGSSLNARIPPGFGGLYT